MDGDIGDLQFKDQKQWVDWTHQLGFEYYLVDEGWERWKDPWKSLASVAEYAKTKNVKVWLWVHSNEVKDPEARKAYFRRAVDAGIAGVKIDFPPACNRWWSNFGLLTGFAEQHFTNVRMGLAAHLEGVMNGIFLRALGAAWNSLGLSHRTKALAFWIVLYGTYANWAFSTLAAAFGTAALSPITAAGHSGHAWQENLIFGSWRRIYFTTVVRGNQFPEGVGEEQCAHVASSARGVVRDRRALD